MSSAEFVLVENAERIIVRARLFGDGLEVHFADGARGTIPPEVVGGQHRVPATGVVIPSPYHLVVQYGRSSRETFPWDYLRGFCDPHHETRARAQADEGRRNLARQLRTLRRSQGMSQAALAQAAGIGRVTLARIETAAQSPGLATLEALARGLGIELADIVAPTP